MKFFKFILSIPFVIILEFILRIRNFLYDINVLHSKSYSDLTIICIGNLSFGGTGKTPHVEYLLNLLINKSNKNPEIATLSRGYGRKTKGFFLVQKEHSSYEVGDEPLQFKHKFPDIPVAIDENRQRGIKKLVELYPTLKVILLDDAFQHRKISSDLSILLTDYSNLYVNDHLFPLGTLREPKSSSKRADIIIITKGSKFISSLEQRTVREKLSPLPHQKVFFSYMEYLEIIPFEDEIEFLSFDTILQEKYSVLLVSGVAKSIDLEYHLKENINDFVHLKYPDHFYFSTEDIMFIKEKFREIKNPKKIILTTEKDSKRLKNTDISKSLSEIPIYYIPIKINFAAKDEEEFNQTILDYVRRNKVNSDILKKQD